MKPRKTISPQIFWLASLLFFVSGGTGLAYQVVWFKRFAHVWGSSSLAFAAVGGSFLFGLGLGAYLSGRMTDRVSVPLRWYGFCELAIGALALLIPFEIAALVDASVGLYSVIPEAPLWRFLIQFCITLVVIGPPCMLMGGTLPLLIRQLTTREGSLDQATGWLYAINTFGAALGCYLTGFHLLPSFGLLATNNMAAGVNIGIGAVSIFVTNKLRVHAQPRKSPSLVPAVAANTKTGRTGMALARLYLATALTGCGALVLEMTWTRQLALILGGSTYAFTATLFVVLFGIALGSLIYHWRLRRAEPAWRVVAVIIGILAISTLAGKLLLPWLTMAVAPENVREMRGGQLGNGLICVGISAALELLPAIAMGLLFPLFVRMTQASAERVGAAVGNIYAWNTLGSIAGASLTALLLFPTIGTAGAVALAVALYVVALFAVIPWQQKSDVTWGGAAAAIGAAIVVLLARPIDPRLTNLGLYIYGDAVIRQAGPDWISTITTVYFREGASSNVLVNTEASGVLSLRVNGKVDASNGEDMTTQLGLAYLPRLLKPDAREVLVIGFGSGCTSGASLLFPDTRVTCCEIEPLVFDATSEFAEYNHRPQEKSRSWLEARNAELPANQRLNAEQIDAAARFSMVFGDGRTAIQGTNLKYDLIISEPSNPWLAGVSNLFTREFFRAARERLTDDGVLAQWIQTYNFTISDYMMIVRTLRSEFSHFGVMLSANGQDTVLLASNRPLVPREEQLAELQKTVDASEELHGDLRKWFGKTDLRQLLVENYQLGEEQLAGLLAQDPSQDLNTDLNLRLEFDAPLHLFRQPSTRDSATVALLAAVDPKWMEQMAVAVGLPKESAEFHSLMGGHFLRRATNPSIVPREKTLDTERAATALETALAADPKSLAAHRMMAQIRSLQGRADDVLIHTAELVRLTPDDASAHAELAQLLLEQKKIAEAVNHFREALRLRPEVTVQGGNVIWANNLAWIMATSPDDKLRSGDEATQWARQACEAVKYKDPSLLGTLAAALAEAGQFDEAIKVSQQQIDLAQGQQKIIDDAQTRIELYRALKPYRDE